MKFFKLFDRFARDEDGAVTVDWVVLTAAVVGLGMAVGAAIRGGVQDLTQDSSNTMTGYTISTTF
ncbi:MAG: Flp family type IVb pilin [Hasllibacter sp.]